jgi:hypothetical protein
MTSFARELDALIAKHVGKNPKFGGDLQPVCDALNTANEKWAMQADRLRWRGESEREFQDRVAGI